MIQSSFVFHCYCAIIYIGDSRQNIFIAFLAFYLSEVLRLVEKPGFDIKKENIE